MSLTPRIDNLEAGENLLINGAFDFWQRSTSETLSTTPQYITADRWQMEWSGAGGADSIRSTVVPTSEFKYSNESNQSGVGTQTRRFMQRIQAASMGRMVGKTLTLSVYIQQVSDVKDINLAIYVPTAGTANGWASAETTAETLVHSETISSASMVSGSWYRVSTQFVVPVGAFNGMAVSISTVNHTTSGSLTRLTGAMLSPGTVDTLGSFCRAGKTMHQEWELCRYFHKTMAISTNYAFNLIMTGFSTTEVRGQMSEAVGMRGAYDGNTTTLSNSNSNLRLFRYDNTSNPAIPGGTISVTINTGNGAFSVTGLSGVVSGSLYYFRTDGSGSTALRLDSEL